MRIVMIAALLAALPACTSDDAAEPGTKTLALAEPEYREVVPEPGIARTWEFDPTYYPIEQNPEDLDADGITAEEDPDDENDAVLPGAFDVPCNGQDEDGDGLDACPADVDGDGARADVDCDDGDSGKGPRAREILCNGIDENCDGVDDCDLDRDGVVDREDLDSRDPEIGSGHEPPERPTL